MSDALRAAAERLPAIDTGDHVFHAPSRETWVVAYVRGDRLAACGWPDTLAALSDCKLVYKASAEERVELLRGMARSPGRRGDHARAALAAEQPQPVCPYIRSSGTGDWATNWCSLNGPPPPAAEPITDARVDAALAAWDAEVVAYDRRHPTGGSWTECVRRALRAALAAAAKERGR